MKTRYLSNNVFKRKLRNGECVKREWLLYSPSQGRLYCFVCHLLSKKESPFATSGFNDWKHCSNVIVEHENGEEHRKCMAAYLIRHKETGSVVSLLLEQHRSEQEYWHKVLTCGFCNSLSCLQTFTISWRKSYYWVSKKWQLFRHTRAVE